MDPGLGKTSTVLAAFSILKEQGYAGRMLIIAPLRPMRYVWPAEIEKWADFNHLTYRILHGPRKDYDIDDDVDIYLVNPEGLKWLSQPKVNGWERLGCDVLCVDESTKFKNSSTQRFKYLKAHIPDFSRRWILTGTFSPNGIMDIFGQVYVLDAGRALGKYITHFRNKYFDMDPWTYEYTPRPGAHAAIQSRIAPLVLQLNAEDWLQMPDLITRDITVELPQEARRMYDEVEREFITSIASGEIVASNAAAAGTKCRQIANGAVYVGGKSWVPVHDEKLDALESLMAELEGKPILLLYEYDHDRQRIQERWDVPCLGSSVSEKMQDAYMKRFNAGDLPILMGHPASMGHGLNLQGNCHHIVWYGMTWNFEHYDQAIRRVYRQGQQSDKVFNYRIIAKNTYDERVAMVLARKERDQKSLLQMLASYRA